ncbi:MAG: ATP-binding protein [Candidatus Krumholzibacteriia bacterium]
MPSLNLKAKFAVVTGVMILAVATIITTFLTRQQEATIRDELLRRAVALTENLAYNCQLPLVTENTTSLRRLANGLLKDGEVRYVQFQDAAGAVVVRVGGVDMDSLRVGGVSGVQEHTDGTRSTWLHTASGVKYLDVYAPVTVLASREGDILSSRQQVDGEEHLGNVRVGMTTQGAEERIAAMRRLATLLGVAIALAGSLLAAAAIHFMTRPLGLLMEGNRRVARGDFSVRLQVRSRDEFGRLARSWNQMADEIQRSRELANSYLESLRQNADDLEEANRALQLKNAEIAKVSRMKSEFLAVMSHELRTPLNGIIGFSEVLLDQKYGRLNEKQRRFASNTLTSGRHLLTLINDILDLSKIEAGKMQVAPTPFDLQQSLEEIQSLVRNLATKKGVEVRCEEVPASTPVTDAKLFRQVMFNLLSNAIKFTPSDGRVDITVRCLGGRVLRNETISRAMQAGRREAIPDRQLVLVEVQDTGVGIAPEDYEKIFVAFQQIDTSYARRQEGTGLGLALTRQIVRLLGGDIWFTSRLGEGSRFMFYVPLQFGDEDTTVARAPGDEDRGDAAADAGPAAADEPAEQRFEEVLDNERMMARALWPWGDRVASHPHAGSQAEADTPGSKPRGKETALASAHSGEEQA